MTVAILSPAQLRVGMILWQGPKGERTYELLEIRDKSFVMKNRETGTRCEESYNFVQLYREITNEELKEATPNDR